MNGKQMPAHAVEMPDGRTLSEHLAEYQTEVANQSADLDALETEASKLSGQQEHQAVHPGGHLASHILSDADYALDPTTDLRLEDYLAEVVTARGPYRRLATNLSAWTGKPIIRSWKRLKQYRAETLTNLDPVSVANSLVLAKLFRQDPYFTIPFDIPSSDGAYAVTAGTLTLGKLADNTYVGQAVYDTGPKLLTGGVDMRSVGIINWNQAGTGVSVQIKTAASLSSVTPENLALARPVTTNFTGAAGYPSPSIITDGTDNNPLNPVTAAGLTSDGDWPWVLIDLGYPLDVNKLVVTHAYDPRGWPYATNYGWRVYDSVLEVSETGDDDDWQTLYFTDRSNQKSYWYYEGPAGAAHVFPTRKIRYIRDKCQQGVWVEIKAYGPSLDEVPWTSVQKADNLFADPFHGGHKYYQLRVTLTGGDATGGAGTLSVTDLAPGPDSQNVVFDAAGVHLTKGATGGVWRSTPVVIAQDNVVIDGFLTTGAVQDGVRWQYRLGMTRNSVTTWDGWQLAADGHGLHPLAGPQGHDTIQFQATLQRLYGTDPSPTVTGLDITYTATTYLTTPSISNLRMAPYIQYYAQDGSLTILVDTETTGSQFDYLRWFSTLVENTGLSVEVRTSDTFPFDDLTQAYQPVLASGDPIPMLGRYLQIKLTLSSETGLATSQINGVELQYRLDRQFEANRDLVELTGDMVRTAFELRRKTLSQQQGELRHLVLDPFTDFTGIDGRSTNLSLDATTRSVGNTGPEGALITEPFTLSATALMFLAAASLGNDGLVRAFYATFPDETSLTMNEPDWIEIGLNEQRLQLDTALVDQIVRLKIAVAGSARLYSWGLAYWL